MNAPTADNQALAALFEPSSIAIVGASEDSSRMGGGLIMRFLELHNYGGTVYPVNPNLVSRGFSNVRGKSFI